MTDTPSEKAYGAANDLEADLCTVLDQYKLAEPNTSPLRLARYLIRQLDNFRETLGEINSDYASNQRAVESPGSGGSHN